MAAGEHATIADDHADRSFPSAAMSDGGVR
jgi:hypothetical protein